MSFSVYNQKTCSVNRLCGGIILEKNNYLISDQISIENLIKVQGKPLLLNVDTEGLTSIGWAKHNQSAINKLVTDNGALLIRGLQINSSKQFGMILSAIFGAELIEYVYRSTPRTQLRGHVYTATEYPSSETIPQHNENSYARNWPGRIGFFCLQPPEAGGKTPISDSRIILEMLPKEVVNEFRDKGVMYVRNYGDVDIPWTTVFQTNDKSVVEKYCRENGLEFEWLADGKLRTKQVNPALVIHPETKEEIWFNQAHLFHVSNLGDDLGNNLLDILGVDNLPRNAYFGDGSPIDVEVLKIISKTYEENTIRFSWEKGDLLLLDNILFTHGREPFSGERKVLTGMACPHSF